MAENEELKGLEFEIGVESKDAIKGINELADAFKGLKKSTSSAGGLSNVLKKLEAINKIKLNTFAIDKLKNLTEHLSKLNNVKLSSTIGKELPKIGAALNGITMSQIDKAELLANALKDLKDVKIPSQFMDSQKWTPHSSESKATVEPIESPTVDIEAGTKVSVFERLRSILAGLAISIRRVSLGTLSKGFHLAASGAKSLGKAIKGITLDRLTAKAKESTKRFGELFSSLKRIAMYRAIRSFFSQLTNAIKVGVNNLYQYSDAVNGRFKDSMDRVATSVQYLQNSMGAMVSPLINALAPAVDFLIDKFVTLLNVINQVFARLSGATSWTRATKAAKSYGDSISGAGGSAKKAAKEIKDATVGIDELNVITQNAKDNASGGGGGSNFADMFENVPIDQGISDFVDKAKEAFNLGDWKSLGILLGEKFNELIDNIDWRAWGHKVGYYINGGIETAYYFLKTANFHKLGSHLADFFNSAISEINWNVTGRLLTRGLTSILDLIMGFFGRVNYKKVAISIKDFFVGMFDEMSDWIDSYDWSMVGHHLYKNIKDFITNMDFGAIASSFVTMLGKAIVAAVKFIGSFISDFIKDVANYFKTFIDAERAKGIYEAGEDVAAGFLKGIVSIFTNIGKWIMDNIVTPFVDAIKEGFGIHSPSKVMEEIGKYVVEGFINGINLFKNIGELIKGFAKDIIEWFSKGKDGKGIVEHFREFGTDIVSGFRERVGNTYTTVRNNITTWATNTKSWFSNIASRSAFSGFANDVVSGFREKIGSTYTTVRTNVNTWATQVNSWFTTVASKSAFMGFANDVVAGFREKIGTAYTTVRSNMNTFASSVKTWFSSIASNSAFAAFATDVINGFKDRIGSAYTTAQSAMTTFANSVKTWFSKPNGTSLVSSFSEIGSNIIQGFIDGVNSLWDSAMETIRSFGRSIISTGKKATKEHSPSRAFREIGAFVIEGFNLGVQDMIPDSMNVMNEWADKIKSYSPVLTMGVDTSAMRYYDSPAFARQVEASVNTNSTVTATGFTEGMEGFYKEYMEPLLLQMADDMKRQADKGEQTVVQIGNRVVTDAVTTQKKANGFSFTS